jgi:hypothetical protein
MLTGGCACGAVRYEVSADPAMAAHCYCRDCQRASGGAMASVFLVPKPAFKVTKGELKNYESTADSGNKVTRGFCANCGSPIVSNLAAMPMIAVKAGSLDDPSKFKPGANIYMASAPAWAPVREELPKFAKMPS